MKLGRRHEPDERDRDYPLRALLSKTTATYKYWWDNEVWLDQGENGTCVGNGWAHFYADSPHTHEGVTEDEAISIYLRATELDSFLDNNDDLQAGTSVRAGVKAMREEGRVASFHWAFSLKDVIDALLTTGPVVLGIDWYEAMFTPTMVKDALGDRRCTVQVKGDKAGGHCLVANGVNVPRKLVRLKNSWGRSWGEQGRASISFDDLDKLLSDQGEACVALEP